MWKAAAFTALIAIPATAQDALPRFELDGNFSYGARNTYTSPEPESEESDNDIIRYTQGLTWRLSRDRQTRLAAELGVRNEDFSNDGYTGMFGVEHSFTWNSDWGRQSLGGRIRWAHDRETTGEAGYAVEWFRGDWAARGVIAYQGINNADNITERDGSSAFGLAEVTWFPIDDLAFWLGISGDSDGDIGGVGIEYRPGRLPVSFFLEWGHTLVEYRGLEGYNDLYGGIRYVPRSRSLKEHRKAVTDRSFARYVEVQ